MATTKATLYLDEKMYKTIKLRAAETGHTLSELMNDALQAQLAEDLIDIKTISDRLERKEKPIGYEQALKELRKNGVI